MSDLRIGYSNFMIAANIFEREGLGLESLWLGPRVETYRADDEGNLFRFDIDLGIGNEFAADFLALTRMDRSRPRSSIAVTVVGADDESFSPLEFFGSGVSTLDGPNEEDFVLFATPGGGSGFEITQDYRYYRVDCALLAGTEPIDLAGIYFGESWDFGTNPVTPARNTFEQFGAGSRVTERRLRLRWEGITQARKTEFVERVYKDKDVAPVVLLDSSGCILDGEKVINCYMEDARFEVRPGDRYNVEVTFLELT